MSQSAASLTPTMPRPMVPVAAARATPQVDADRRRHARFEVNLLGRFMRADKQEFPCRVTGLSVGDANVIAPASVSEGERIVAYIDHIGGIEGHVIRVDDGAFAINITATQHKREKLAAQITWLINRSEIEGIEARRPGHDRITSSGQATVLRIGNGPEIEVRLQDLSISGASVLTTLRPPVGTEVGLGKLRAIVMRHHGEGIGVQFADIQNPDALRRYFG